MNWSASVVTALSSDTDPSILVSFEQAKYLFNAGENTTRAFMQGRSSFGKTRAVFLSSLGTQRTAGLPGFLITAAQANVSPKLDVIGPSGLSHLIASMRCYITRDEIALICKEIPSHRILPSTEPEPVFQDKNITVYAIPIHSENALSQPLTEEAELPDTSSSFLKRKRSASPPSTSKRPAPSTSDVPSSARRDDEPSLVKLMRAPGFTPHTLTGALADAYRQLIVQGSFFRRPEPCPADLDFVQIPKTQKERPKKKGSSSAPPQDPAPVDAAPLGAGPPPPPGGTARTFAPLARRPARPSSFLRALPAIASAEKLVPEAHRSTLAWAVVGPRVRGKFDAQKAKELGLPNGPVRARLIAGEVVRVQVDDGMGGKVEREVHPEEVVGASEAPVVMLVLDIPTPNHIPSLIKAFEDPSYFARFRSATEEERKERRVHAVFHLCGDGVLEDERYKTFMNTFSLDTQHLVSSRQHGPDPVTFVTAGQNTLRLNQLDPAVFPVPKFRLDAPIDLKSLEGYPSNVSSLQSNLVINMRPPSAPALDPLGLKADHFHPAATGADELDIPGATRELFASAKQEIAEQVERRSSNAQPGDDVRVIPLGTSSASPTLLRNVSSILLMSPTGGNILLDAGEGTWGQLARMFGENGLHSEGAWQVLRDLKCIFLSHVHGDHVIGTAKLLSMRKQLDPPPTEPLYVLGTRQVLLGLQDQAEVQDLGLHDGGAGGVRLACTEMLLWRKPQKSAARAPGADWVREQPWLDEQVSQEVVTGLCEAMGLQSFVTALVYHSCVAYAAIITHRDGWKIVYSGDTKPCGELAAAGAGATLLIHEATLADEQWDLADFKKHSTLGQAVEIGRRMKAKNLLLTHFSARYPKVPPKTVEKVAGNLALALDGSDMRIGDLWKMAIYQPAIEHAIDETAEADGVELESSAQLVD